MVIAIDAGCLGVNDKRLKVGVYNLAKNLLIELGKKDKKNTYILYSFHSIDKKLMKEFGGRMKNIVLSKKGYLKAWTTLRLSKDKPDVFLALGQALPKFSFFRPKKVIGFVYDIAFEQFPQFYPGSYKRLSKNTKDLISHSDKIVTISESAKKDIRKFYHVGLDSLVVAYPGVSKEFFIGKTKRRLKKPYFLFVGSLKPGKNVRRIIEGFSYFLKNTGASIELLLAGGMWLDTSIQEVFQQNELGKRVRFLGFVEKDKLKELYAFAFAFVSPSICEGFGLPLLEAMAKGCPVITSDYGSMKEIVQKTGILVDPKSSISIGKAMMKLHQNTKLRKLLGKKGKERARRFGWDSFAKNVMNLYET